MVLFPTSELPSGVFSPHWASVLGSPPPGLRTKGASCQRCWGALRHPEPCRQRPSPCRQPARGCLFPLLWAEAKLVFPPCLGIAPQKRTMQLLKYLGLSGRAHSGLLVPLADNGPAGLSGEPACASRLPVGVSGRDLGPRGSMLWDFHRGQTVAFG